MAVGVPAPSSADSSSSRAGSRGVGPLRGSGGGRRPLDGRRRAGALVVGAARLRGVGPLGRLRAGGGLGLVRLSPRPLRPRPPPRPSPRRPRPRAARRRPPRPCRPPRRCRCRPGRRPPHPARRPRRPGWPARSPWAGPPRRPQRSRRRPAGSGADRLRLNAPRGVGLGDHSGLQLLRALGRAARPIAQAAQLPRLREIEDREHGQAEERSDADIRAVLLDLVLERER